MSKADRPLNRDAYPEQIEERLRFADTDLVGHVNNAAFATLFEIGRVSFLFDPENPLFEDNDTFVLARLNIDFLGELRFPGMVTIATGVSRVGSSSATIMQAVSNTAQRVLRSASGLPVLFRLKPYLNQVRPIISGVI